MTINLRIENKEITRGLAPIKFFDLTFKRRKTYLLGEQSYGESLYYLGDNPEFHFSWFDKENYGNSIVELQNFISKNKANNWKVIKRLAQRLDHNLTDRPPILAVLFNWNPYAKGEMLKLKILPIKELWETLTENDKLALLK